MYVLNICLTPGFNLPKSQDTDAFMLETTEFIYTTALKKKNLQKLFSDLVISFSITFFYCVHLITRFANTDNGNTLLRKMTLLGKQGN